MPCGKVLRLCKKISFSGQLQFYPNPGHTMTMIVPASVSRTLAIA
ncbi:hypothetical protein EC971742_0971 [Escherichia coli 97.1742]|jgi:hypothetical protein|nr:hypothetical protein EC971742_0971 [Escherichia coli 97.1742]